MKSIQLEGVLKATTVRLRRSQSYKVIDDVHSNTIAIAIKIIRI